MLKYYQFKFQGNRFGRTRETGKRPKDVTFFAHPTCIIISHEGMNDLCYLLGRLVSVDGKILVDGMYDQVAPVTHAERLLYDNIDFDMVPFSAS